MLLLYLAKDMGRWICNIKSSRAPFDRHLISGFVKLLVFIFSKLIALSSRRRLKKI